MTEARDELVALRRRNAELEAEVARLSREHAEGARRVDAAGLLESRYHRLIQASTEEVFQVDAEPPIPLDLPPAEQAALMLERGVVRECNDAYARAAGFQHADEVIGRRVDEVWPASRAEKLAVLVEHALEGFTSRSMELRLRGPDEAPRIMLGSVTGFVEHGALVYLWGVMRDVTAERNAEEARRTAITRYEDFVQQSTEPVFRCDCAPPLPLDVDDATSLAEQYLDRAMVAECNDAFARWCGSARAEQVRGRRLADVLPGSRESKLALLAPAARADFATGEYEFEMQAEDGDARRYSARIVGVVHDGSLAHVWASLRDVTERRRAEGRLRDVFDNAVEAIFVIDVATDGQLTLESLNPMCEQGVGRPAAEIRGKPLDVALPPTIAALASANCRRCLETGAPVDYEATLDVPPPQRIWQAKLVPIRDSRGRICRIAGFARDVTLERREQAVREQLEDRLREAHKMEAMGRIAGAVAHDFNNLLGVILGYGGLIQHAPGAGILAGEVGEIVNAAQRGAALTRQLLAFSRQQVVAPVTLDLNTVVLGMGRLLERLLGEDVKLTVDLDPTPALVVADAGQIEQVVMNLAVNARDAMPRGGVVTITTRNVVRSERGASEVRLTVADTGSGIAKEDLPHIFEPFFTTKDAGRGTGLGLATVYGVVTQGHGEVTVESELGRGTTFLIHLPRAANVPASAGEPIERATKAEPVAPRAAPPTILLVEDNEQLRGIVRRTLEEKGYIVFAARSGQDAFVLADRIAGDLDLLLTDIAMPGMTGPALAERLVHRFKRLHVLYMSGHPGMPLEADFGGAVAERFLGKPFTPAMLTKKVSEVLAGPWISAEQH